MAGRRLIPAEQAMELLTQCRGTLNILTISRLRGRVEPTQFKGALARLQDQSPYLQARIVGRSGRYSFVYGEAEPIPFRVLPQATETAINGAIAAELNTPISSDSCLMRCILLLGSPPHAAHHLLITLHHAIADGRSALQLVSTLLSRYEQIRSEQPQAQHAPIQKLYSVADCLPQTLRGLAGLAQTALFLPQLQQQIWQHPAQLPVAESVPLSQRRCGWTKRILTDSVVQTLRLQAHKAQTSIQGVLCAAMMISFYRIHASQELCKMGCGSYVDLRSRCLPTVNPSYLGLFAAFIATFHTLESDLELWAIARQVKQQLQCGLDQQDMFKTLGVSQWVINQQLKQPDQPPLPLNVTNVGQLNMPRKYDDLKLEETAFIPANAVFGGSILLAATTFGDRTVLYFVASEPGIDPPALGTFADQVIVTLKAAALHQADA